MLHWPLWRGGVSEDSVGQACSLRQVFNFPARLTNELSIVILKIVFRIENRNIFNISRKQNDVPLCQCRGRYGG